MSEEALVRERKRRETLIRCVMYQREEETVEEDDAGWRTVERGGAGAEEEERPLSNKTPATNGWSQRVGDFGLVCDGLEGGRDR